MTEPVDPGAQWPPQQPYGGYPQQQPYGYPQGPYPQQPYAYPAPPPPPPAPPRHNVRRIVIASVVAAVVVAGAVTAGLVASNSSGDNSASAEKTQTAQQLVAPQSVGEYHVLAGAAADQVQSAARGVAAKMGGSAATLIQHATIAAYSNQGAEPTLVFLGMTRSEVAKLGGFGDDATIVRQFLSGAVTDSQAFDSGSRGGALRCGAAIFGAVSQSMCAWSDSHTIGMIESVNPAKPPQQLADTANQFRDALS